MIRRIISDQNSVYEELSQNVYLKKNWTSIWIRKPRDCKIPKWKRMIGWNCFSNLQTNTNVRHNAQESIRIEILVHGFIIIRNMLSATNVHDTWSYHKTSILHEHWMFIFREKSCAIKNWYYLSL
jgi:hypothetical protein